jgi:hypothetical protein
VSYLFSIATFAVIVGVYYSLIGRERTRERTRGAGVGFVLAICAAFPLLDGGVLLVWEWGRREAAGVASTVIDAKYSSTGENGTRTIGGSRFSRPSRTVAWLNTSEGFRADDVLARVLLTGSKNAWVVEYRYACEASRGCVQREFVSYELWSRLHVGQIVNIRAAKEPGDSGRIDENPMWNIAFAKLAIGGIVALAAALASASLTLRRREFLTVPAVITSIESVNAGGKRVVFAYTAADGVTHESIDEVYAGNLKAGDDCLAVYPADRPHLGSLRVLHS